VPPAAPLVDCDPPPFRLVRGRNAGWNVKMLGVMGFSASGHGSGVHPGESAPVDPRIVRFQERLK
jgi:hypothetical protein